MESIKAVSRRERVFYFSDFIYFVDAIDYTHPNSLRVTIGRIVELLILFDKIMIPSEHITISRSENESQFKLKFFSHRVIQTLIEQRKVVTTIWAVCRDAQDHLDASNRYKRDISAEIVENIELSKQIASISLFKRNQSGQSTTALEQAKVNGWKYGSSTEDFLSYSDGEIEIPFSHERLLLGDGRGKFVDKSSLNAAKLAYIQAMPSGNGGIYRSLISNIELAKGEGMASHIDRLPSAYFTPKVYRQLLRKTGLNAPYSNQALLNPAWLTDMDNLILTRGYAKFKDRVFLALEEISKIVFATNEDQAGELLKSVNYLRFGDVSVLAWRMIKLHNLFPKITAMRRNQLINRYYFLPSYPVKEINHMATTYS